MHIWFTGPPAGVPPLWYTLVADAYMAGRAHSVPQRPPLDLKQLRGGVLAPARSGVGADGRPYEVYHLHPQLFVLRDTAFDHTNPAGNLLAGVFGDAVELLMWIPKALGS